MRSYLTFAFVALALAAGFVTISTMTARPTLVCATSDCSGRS